MKGPASSLIRGGNPQGAKPYERFLLSPTALGQLPAALGQDAELALLWLWADAAQLHACFLHEPSAGAVFPFHTMCSRPWPLATLQLLPSHLQLQPTSAAGSKPPAPTPRLSTSLPRAATPNVCETSPTPI